MADTPEERLHAAGLEPRTGAGLLIVPGPRFPMPAPTVPAIDRSTGRLTPIWYDWLVQLQRSIP